MAFSAASFMCSAVMTFRPLSAIIARASGALVPCRRTTSGTSMPTSLIAVSTPSAIQSQRTMPPKMLTITHFTLGSDRMILNAAVTDSTLTPPPTSRKLAGSPPCSLMMSIVAIARPAPLTMQPMSPSSLT